MSAEPTRYVIRESRDNFGPLFYCCRENEPHPAHWGGHLSRELAQQWIAEHGGVEVTR